MVALVGGGDHVEHQSRAGITGWHVPQLAEDQQVQLAQLAEQPQELPFFRGFQAAE